MLWTKADTMAVTLSQNEISACAAKFVDDAERVAFLFEKYSELVAKG